MCTLLITRPVFRGYHYQQLTSTLRILPLVPRLKVTSTGSQISSPRKKGCTANRSFTRSWHTGCVSDIRSSSSDKRLSAARQSFAMETRLRFFDSHCHLQDPRLDGHLDELLGEATETGVQWLVVNSTSENDWDSVRELADAHPQVIPSFGLHPWYVESRSADWMQRLRSLLTDIPCAAIGEAGLDKGSKGKLIDMDTQVAVLREQLLLAQELRRPVAVHCVRAFGPMHDLIRGLGHFPAGLVLHSYLGSPEVVTALVEHGAYFSFSGFLTDLSPAKAKKILKAVPEDRFLLETDCPDALPRLERSHLVSRVRGDASAPRDARQAGEGEGHGGGGGESGSQDESECEDRQQKETGRGSSSDPGGRIPAASDARRGAEGSGARGLVDKKMERNCLNHPANIKMVAQAVANLMDLPVEEISARAYRNSVRLFSFANSRVTPN